MTELGRMAENSDCMPTAWPAAGTGRKACRFRPGYRRSSRPLRYRLKLSNGTVERLVAGSRSELAAFAGADQRVISRSGELKRVAAVQPLRQSPPQLEGKSREATVQFSSFLTTVMPHCIAQYGQWVKPANGEGATSITIVKSWQLPCRRHPK